MSKKEYHRSSVYLKSLSSHFFTCPLLFPFLFHKNQYDSIFNNREQRPSRHHHHHIVHHPTSIRLEREREREREKERKI